MNCLVFSGNLGSDSVIKATKNGTLILEFSVAMNSGYGEGKKTTWVRCKKFGKGIEGLKPYLLTGQQVVVSGEATLAKWENADGPQAMLECKVNDVTLVGGKPAEATEPPRRKQEQAGQFVDDEIPFD